MDEQRWQDYLAMKAALTKILERLNDQIEFYPTDDDEEKYRDLIRQIDHELNQILIMKEQARFYYERFKVADTSGERKTISVEFQRFFSGLSNEEKRELGPLLDEILRDGETLAAEGDVLAERIEQMLAEDHRLKMSVAP